MALNLYNNISAFISELLKRSRFFDESDESLYNFEFRWGMQPIIPIVDQNDPFFYAYIKRIERNGLGNMVRDEMTDTSSHVTYAMNYRVTLILAFVQQKQVEEFPIGPLDDRAADGSLILAEVLNGLWSCSIKGIYHRHNIGIIEPGPIINRSRVISGRYVRVFTTELVFDTLGFLEEDIPTLDSVCIKGAERDTGAEIEFCLETEDR